MTRTAFASDQQFDLIDGSETPFSWLEPHRVVPVPDISTVRSYQRLARRLYDLTEALSVESTPFMSSGVEDLIHGRSFGHEETIDEDEDLRQRAAAAVARLMSVLSASEQHVARMSGISRNTIASWRSGDRSPYPATVRPLFEIEMLVSSVVDRLGVAQARDWFGGYGPDGLTRLEFLLEAIRSGVAIPSSTLEEAGIDLPNTSWKALSSLQARFPVAITADEDGNVLTHARLSSEPALELDDELEFLTD
jgi:hypothetical protein